MQVHSYLSFKGDCEAAFNLYARCFGGTLGEMFRYGGSPIAGEVPSGWEDKVMHGSVTIAGQVVMGADIAPDRYEAPAVFSLSIHLADAAEADRFYRELSADGKILMPLEKTFWAERFGMFIDRFGTPWSINCGEAGK